MLKKIIFRNLIFYWKKAVLIISLMALLFFMTLASILFTNRIQQLADRPLEAIGTEIILQKDSASKNPADIRTQGVIFPFNLQNFSKESIETDLRAIPETKDFSTALMLWQFDLKNNKTIVGLNTGDPKIGLRKIEDWLMPGSRFFSKDSAQEIILERHFAKLFGFKRGEKYSINGQDYDIIGIVDFTEESNLSNAQIFMPYKTALSLVSSKDQIINQVYVSLENASLLSEAQKSISERLPNLTIITKDRLLKNISAFNRLIYRFGNYFVGGMILIVAVLSFFIFKMFSLEFQSQTAILKTIGWPKQEIRHWKLIEIIFIAGSAFVISLLFLGIFNFTILPNIHFDSLLNQNFTL